MFSAKPYNISVVGERELTDQDMNYIRSMVPKFTDYRTTNQLDNHRQYYDLPDGGYFVVQDMGGIFKVVATKDSESRLLKPDGYANPEYVPMLFSGDISTARYLKDSPVALVISEQTRRRLVNYDPNAQLPSRNIQLKRFNVEPNLSLVPELAGLTSGSNFSPTQYTQQRPTLYSGAMAEVMQIVGGYGKQPTEVEETDDLEMKSLKLPDQYLDLIREELDGVRLPAYTGVPPVDGQFQYDYKFEKTDGVAFDDTNKPWLVRVSRAGVFAMPLPVVPATASPHFRKYIEQVGDEEIENILNRFGAMPSGEGFPANTSDFEAWRRAGVIVKVCDVADFYSNIAYFSACGWSFNSRGNAAVNTCYTYEDSGTIIGHTYMLNLTLASASKGGQVGRVELTGDDAIVIGNYMTQLLPQLSGSDARTLATLYKLRRVKVEDLLARASQLNVNVETELVYWDNYEAAPIATHGGSVSVIYSGYLYHNMKPAGQPQIKFPDMVEGACISFDFSPLEGTSPPLANCDTIMFAAFINEELKVVKYFVDWRGYRKQVESTYESVMTVGAWEMTETVGLSSPQGHFYTTDFDYREVYSPVVTHTKIVGKDAGYDSVPFFEFNDFFGMNGWLWRNRYFTHKTTVTQSSTEAIRLAICIPMYDRNALILAQDKFTTGVTENERLELKYVRDPYSYEYWTYDPIFAWRGGLPVMKGQPFPVNGNPVWVEIEHYGPSPLNDFADQGPWIVGLPHDYTWLIHPNKNEWMQSGGGYPPKVKEYSTGRAKPGSSEGCVVYNCTAQPMTAHKNVPAETYFQMSPDPYVGTFYRDACKVVFGNAEYASISEQNVHGKRANWGYTSFTQNEREHHFIGVINE